MTSDTVTRRISMLIGATLAMAAISAGTWAQDDESAAAPPEPSADLRVAVAPETITAGDRAEVTVELVWPAGAPDVDPRFPAWQDTWGQAEILAVGPVERIRAPGGDTVFRQVIEVTAFEVGDAKLPSMVVALPSGDETRELETGDELVLSVESVLPDTETEPEVLPPANAEALPIGQRFIWTTAALSLLTLLAGWRALRARPSRQLAEHRTRPKLPPLAELEQRLRAIDAEQAVPAHTTISLALRGFLGRSTGVPAVERTTTEIRKLLRQSAVDPDLGQRFTTLLARCDEVKFMAGDRTDVATTTERVRAARTLAEDIDRSQRHELPDSDAGDDAGGQAGDGRSSTTGVAA